MAKNAPPQQNGNAPAQQERRYRLVNLMTQKLVVNTVINGVQESLELGIKEKSRFYNTSDFGPHAESLRASKRLMIESD